MRRVSSPSSGASTATARTTTSGGTCGMCTSICSRPLAAARCVLLRHCVTSSSHHPASRRDDARTGLISILLAPCRICCAHHAERDHACCKQAGAGNDSPAPAGPAALRGRLSIHCVTASLPHYLTTSLLQHQRRREITAG